jgi:hypothetical protein
MKAGYKKRIIKKYNLFAGSNIDRWLKKPELTLIAG